MDERKAHRRRLTALLAVVGALALALGAMPTAWAHEGEEDVGAIDNVQEAIALIRSQPELMDLIEDRIGDAIESEDADGVDIAKVEEAEKTFEDGDMIQTELLLEQAIGACPGQPVVDPQGIRMPEPITSPCPAPAHLTAIDRVPVAGTDRFVLVAFAALAIVAGLFLVRRTHVHVD